MSKVRYLIDSASNISVVPPRSRFNPAERKLFPANGSRIATSGQTLVALNLGLRRSFKWIFTITDVNCPIIGADFLQHFGLLLDLKNQRLLDSETFLSTPGWQSNPCDAPQVFTVDPTNKFATLLREFSFISREKPNYKTPAYNVTHQILTNGPRDRDRPCSKTSTG